MSRAPATRRAASLLVIGCLVAGCIPVSGPSRTPAVASPDATGDVATATPAPIGPSGPPSFVRPTPTPLPTFLAYTVRPGDTLSSIAKRFETTTRSIAFWNRAQHPSLDPDSPTYEPDRIAAGWTLLLVPGVELDPEDIPEASPTAAG
ncbi:MAG TPA: LysM peptidoglycan-binding domain-containing protein [Candidatus Limnocylindrales bacterium]|nr:LysM peptidoglycan-binding domain-containing protein [Candidatus Limnocylindrales bacterium]